LSLNHELALVSGSSIYKIKAPASICWGLRRMYARVIYVVALVVGVLEPTALAAEAGIAGLSAGV